MTSTPWGIARSVQEHAPGIIEYLTDGHGGFYLSESRQENMPDCMKNDSGWYEADFEWCKVIVSHPDVFCHEDLGFAYDMLKNWYYRAYEKHTGIILLAGMSYSKDKAVFYEKHKNDWVVISARRCEHNDTLANVVATMGGKWTYNNGQEKRFIVAVEDYEKRDRFGFVITDQTEV